MITIHPNYRWQTLAFLRKWAKDLIMKETDENKKESEFIIKKRELGDLFDSKYDLNINLYRGSNPNNENPVLYPILKAFLLSNGRMRKEDIVTYEKWGELWVDSASGGISLV